ncbi:MAG: tetratricopeptide repeat protein [Bacteroidetes bacterium]|nr:tetratricopeptide repeat protein [Bacteroidota bacterium]MBU1717622.1 tetratricopeptide repeat protein [Bacteroidota bacterium]
MEILKKTIVTVALYLLPAVIVNAQDAKVLQAAFSSSYTHEANAEYSKAIETLKGVYTADSYELNLRLGWLHYLSGLFTESSTYYNKAISLMPYAIEARFGVVYPEAALGNWDKVKNHYLEILKVDGSNTLANYRLGLIYYGKEDYNAAIKCFEKNVNLYPFDYDSVLMFAWTNFKLGKTREAKVLFNKVLLIKPGDTSAIDGLSLIK